MNRMRYFVNPPVRLSEVKLALAAFVVLITPLFAKPSPEFDVDWVAMSMGETLRDVYYQGPSDLERLFIPNAGFSSAQRYEGPSPFYLYELVETLEGPKPKPIGKLNLLSETGELTLFIFAAREGELPYEIYAAPGVPEGIPLFHARVINLTPYSLAGFLDGDAFQLSPGLDRLVEYDGSENRAVSIRIQVASNEGESWSPRVNTSVGVRSNTRLTVIFRMDGDKIEMVPIRETVSQRTPSD